MLNSKIRVAVIFGGTNTEHEVSLVSARSIISHLNPKKYEVIPVLITKQNQWQIGEKVISPFSLDAQVIFPVLHGPYGEDGTIQGLLELMHVPYVGSGVLASAICMDKAVQKQLCQGAGIPVPKFISLSLPPGVVDLGFPLFVKPANQGSSIGVIKVHSIKELNPALTEAFKLDTKVLIEQAIPHAREIECAVLGPTHKPQASLLGEIIPSNEFYDYDAKYVDGKSQAIIPANLDAKTTSTIQTLAKQAFTLTNCYGLARVDFLINGQTNAVYLNELNTMPGFTTISMYPKLWEASGLTYPQILDKLIHLALKRHRQKQAIQLTYTPKKTWYSPAQQK